MLQCRATAFAKRVSSYFSSVKPIEQVWTCDWVDNLLIVLTTNDESTPPDKKAPSGTSAIILSRTDSVTKLSIASLKSLCGGALMP